MHPITKPYSEVRDIDLLESINFQEMKNFHDSLISSNSDDQSGYNHLDNINQQHKLDYQDVVDCGSMLNCG